MRYLSVYAGRTAERLIRDHGLTPDMVEAVAGAAGGPKWLVLCGLDRALFSSWLMERTRPLFLLGSSVGSWRFAALATGMDGHERFLNAYYAQRYPARPTPREVSDEIGRVLDVALGADGPDRILAHPHARLNVLSVRCRSPYTTEARYPLLALIVAAALLNALGRRFLGLFFSRVLFHDARDTAPFFPAGGFSLQRVPLSRENLRDAVMASGSIPLIMSGVPDIPGAGDGMYRDSGILDYHLAVPFNTNGIVLYPHYMERIIPGWFDKPLAHRRPHPRDMENVVVLCPSRTLLDTLPGRRIPSREDFKEYWGRDAERIAFWKQTVRAGHILGEEFLEAVHGGTLAGLIKPIGHLTSGH